MLVLEGLAGLAYYIVIVPRAYLGPKVALFLVATLALPPLLAGAPFLGDWWVSQHPPAPPPRQV